MANPTRQILLVDDNVQDSHLTEVALKSCIEEISVAMARDGAEALDYLYHRGKYQESTHSQPLFVLLDLKMPKLDGFEVLRVAKADEDIGRVPIIVFTSSQHGSDIEACYRLGANAYVAKPVAFDQLLKTMESLCGFWLRTNLRAAP
jgi:CheY-like chemotaxis protein